MRPNPDYALVDEGELRRLIRSSPFATLVSTPAPERIVVSHCPVVVDESSPDLRLVSHLGRPDEVAHELGASTSMLVVHGPNGYISPSWYPPPAPAVPTWNYVVAHLYGRVELLDADENLRALGELVDRFERPLPAPRRMLERAEDAAYAERIQHGTVGFRFIVDRVDAKAKLSQDKPTEVVAAVLDELEGTGPYANDALASEMRCRRDRSRT